MEEGVSYSPIFDHMYVKKLDQKEEYPLVPDAVHGNKEEDGLPPAKRHCGNREQDRVDLGVSWNHVGYSTKKQVACCKTHEKFARFLTDGCVELEEATKNEKTPLHTAARQGDLSSVKYLARNVKYIDQKDTMGKTALHLASENGHLQVVQELLKCGASCLAKDCRNETPISCASKNSHEEILKLFIAYTSNLDIPKRELKLLIRELTSGRTDILRALFSPEVVGDITPWKAFVGSTDENIVESIAFLVLKRLDLMSWVAPKRSSTCECTCPPEEVFFSTQVDFNKVACRKHFPSLFKNLRAGCGYTYQEEIIMKGKEEALRENLADCIESGDVTFVRYCLQRERRNGVMLNAGSSSIQSDKFNFPKEFVERENQVDFICYLFEFAAELNRKEKTIDLCLFNAAKYGMKNLLEFILKSGRNPNISYGKGETPLNRAIIQRHTECMDLLLKHKAKLDPPTSDLCGTLEIAVQYGNSSIAQVLTKNGVDLKVVDKDQRSMLHIASKFNNDPDVINYLLNMGLDIDKQDVDGNTPLLTAVMVGNKAVVRTLLEHAADMKIKNKSGRTVYIEAAYRKQWKVFELLLEANFKFDDVDSFGNSALHIAVSEEDKVGVNFLIEKGHNVKCRNGRNFTPLHIAVKLVFLDAIDALIAAGGVIVGKDRCRLTRQQLSYEETVDALLEFRALARELNILDLQPVHDANIFLNRITKMPPSNSQDLSVEH